MQTMNQLQTIVLFLSMCLWNSPVFGQNLNLPWDGIDVSFLPQVEAGGGVFKDGAQQLSLPTILANHGIKVARLRLWHTPAGGINGLNYTLDLAERLHKKGINIILDFHYSDSWADPEKQTKPKAWKNLSFTDLTNAIRVYTRDSLAAFIARGIPLIAVQIGNETPSGMLWPDGRVGGVYETPKQWSKLGTLFRSAREGIEAAYSGQMLPKVVIHLDDGGSRELFSWFFNNLKLQNVTFDVIGVSFYPWLNDTLSDLRDNLLYCVTEFSKDIAVVETSYPWTLQWFDYEHNIVGLDHQFHQGYEATPAGQAEFISAVKDILVNLPDKRGLGVVYWAGDWITSDNSSSSWENLALFNNEGQNLPALDVLGFLGSLPTPLPTARPTVLPTPRLTPLPTPLPTSRLTPRLTPRPTPRPTLRPAPRPMRSRT